MTASSADIAKQIKSLLKESADDRTDAARLDELRKLYARLIQTGEFSSKDTTRSRVTKQWRSFLRQQHKRFLGQLLGRIAAGKRTAVRTLWGVLATSPSVSANGQYKLLNESLLQQWVGAMTTLPSLGDQSIRHMVQVEFFQPYRDVQYYSMIAVRQCAHELYQQDSKEKAIKAERAERLVELLMMIPVPTSQQELDRAAGALFAPPQGAIPGNASSASDNDGDDSDSTSEEDNSDAESSHVDEPPSKRVKRDRSERLFSFQQAKCHHLAWSKAWLAVLRLSLPVPTLKNALRFLPESVLPYSQNPLRFADFFMQAYDQNGVVPILALDGLFLLMTQHGLEYPNFYKQLYKLVTPALLYVKYRTRFFRLLSDSLSRNGMLPAHVVAAFVKRLLRSTLTGPPSSALFVLALCSNLLRQHPEMSCLVHRTTDKLEDGFDADTDDPEQAHALQSSLWELGVLERHYYPAVATLAKSVGLDLQTPLLDLNDFLVHTYQSLFEQERKRKQRGETPLTFIEPKSLFVDTDVFAEILDIPHQKTTV